MEQLVPATALRQADKVLFLSHLAIGDFTYLQTYFQAFAQQYPGVRIDLWVDEVRRTRLFWKWKHLRRYALYDWLDACPYFHKIYRHTHSPRLFRESLRQARRERYPVVVSLALLIEKAHRYARYSRAISPDGLTAGVVRPPRWFELRKRRNYRYLDKKVYPDGSGAQPEAHVTDFFASCFEQLFGIRVEPASRAPFVHVPDRWLRDARSRLAAWGVPAQVGEGEGAVLINPYAKHRKRCWPLKKVERLVHAMRGTAPLRQRPCIVNVAPEERARAEHFFKRSNADRVFLFSADEHFFQLPALIAQCDVVVSVETAVGHLAAAMGVPVVSLMRRKNPEWRPWGIERPCVVTGETARDWVAEIPVGPVLQAIRYAVSSGRSRPGTDPRDAAGPADRAAAENKGARPRLRPCSHVLGSFP
jgi:ADP-heptose:LPS heptosyltransferase